VVVSPADLKLPPFSAVAPVRINGTVLDPGGSAIPYAAIRVRAVLCDASGANKVDTVVVAEGIADGTGAYSLILPSDLATKQGACTAS
jgi:hypothetical protein